MNEEISNKGGAARKLNLVAEKSRWRRDSTDNRGGFRIIDPWLNSVVAGVRFDMRAEEVIAYCREKEQL